MKRRRPIPLPDLALSLAKRRAAAETVGGVLRTVDYLSNEVNQYTEIVEAATNRPAYDADGNLLTHEGWTLTWDGENRLAGAEKGAQRLAFVYDYMGRRAIKDVWQGEERTARHVFVYDGWMPVRETIVDRQSTNRNYQVWGLDLSGTQGGAGGIGGLVAVVRAVAGEGAKTRFAVSDAGGNIVRYVTEERSFRSRP